MYFRQQVQTESSNTLVFSSHLASRRILRGSRVPYSLEEKTDCMLLIKYGSKSTWKFKIVNIMEFFVFILLITERI